MACTELPLVDNQQPGGVRVPGLCPLRVFSDDFEVMSDL